ncbi:hypothetical protein E3N88_28213 [Mikania micrantha]|uniref:Uncharacterized protein n=1 Tax=Mikania micrantha TaxID=192012 RepID=A0A5N6N1U9_9ASTR|nr:hypothetical protein E3N88_28213 [Mikania micrantha]
MRHVPSGGFHLFLINEDPLNCHPFSFPTAIIPSDFHHRASSATELPAFEIPDVEAVPKLKKAMLGKAASDVAAPSKRMKTRASKGKAPIVPSDGGVHSLSSGNTAEENVRSEKVRVNSPVKTCASSEHETTHLEKSFSGQPFVPLWDVCNGDLYNNPRVCRDVATALPTPGQKAAVAQLSNTAITDELLTSWVQLGSFVTESFNCWSGCHDKAKEKITILLYKLTKEGERISALEQQVVLLNEEKKQFVLRADEMKEEMRAKEAQLNDSKEEVEKRLAALDEGRVALDEERKVFKAEENKMKTSLEQLVQQNQSLSAKVEKLSKDREWLIVHGFKHVVDLLHRSPEYLEPLAAVQKASHAYGMYSGIRAGYKYAAAGRAMETVSHYAPDSKAKLHQAVDAFEGACFPFLDLILKDSAVPLATLQGLMPQNAENIVAIGG